MNSSLFYLLKQPLLHCCMGFLWKIFHESPKKTKKQVDFSPCVGQWSNLLPGRIQTNSMASQTEQTRPIMPLMEECQTQLLKEVAIWHDMAICTMGNKKHHNIGNEHLNGWAYHNHGVSPEKKGSCWQASKIKTKRINTWKWPWNHCRVLRHFHMWNFRAWNMENHGKFRLLL